MKAISLFSGAGGFDLGVNTAGFQIISAIDINPKHTTNYKMNHPKTLQVLTSDISDVNGKQLTLNRDIDLVFGGSPCQGLSRADKGALADTRKQLIGEFIRLVTDIKPKYFLFENMVGLTYGKYKPLLSHTLSSLRAAGYDVYYSIFNTIPFGVPQDRNHVFIIGSRKDVKKASISSREFVPQRRFNVYDAISDLSWVAAANNYGQDRYLSVLSDYARYLDDCFPQGCRTVRLYDHVKSRHCQRVMNRWRDLAPGGRDDVSRFSRLDPQGTCPAWKAGAGKSKKGYHVSPRPIHYDHCRCITVREAARLHSYPDWYRFDETIHGGIMQVGNSVCPLQAKGLAEKIARLL